MHHRVGLAEGFGLDEAGHGVGQGESARRSAGGGLPRVRPRPAVWSNEELRQYKLSTSASGGAAVPWRFKGFCFRGSHAAAGAINHGLVSGPASDALLYQRRFHGGGFSRSAKDGNFESLSGKLCTSGGT